MFNPNGNPWDCGLQPKVGAPVPTLGEHDKSEATPTALWPASSVRPIKTVRSQPCPCRRRGSKQDELLQAIFPPSIPKIWPVMNGASSEAKKRIVCATSS